MSTMACATLVGSMALACSATTLTAQRPADIWLVAAGSAISTRTTYGGNVATSNGFAFGGQGRLSWSRVSLRLGYAQGSLQGDMHNDGRRYAEGLVLLGASPVRGLEIAAGPHVRAYVSNVDTNDPFNGIGINLGTPADTSGAAAQRWLFWELRARYEMPIYETPAPELAIRAFAELWSAVDGQVNLSDTYESGRGGETGIMVRIAKPPLTVRFTYGIDQARFHSAPRRESVETLTFSVGVNLDGSRTGIVASARGGPPRPGQGDGAPGGAHDR